MNAKLALISAIAVSVAWTQPNISPNGTVNAADYSRTVAPGAIVSIFGTGLASGEAYAQSIPLPTTLAGTSVEVVSGGRTITLPLFAVSSRQINAMLPYGISGAAQVRVRAGGSESSVDTINLVDRAPRFFSVDQTGVGRALLTHPNGDVASRTNPLKPGQFAVLYMNSMGEVTPAAVAGTGANAGGESDPFQRVAAPVEVTINGRLAEIQYAGLVPYFTGLYQVNVIAPYWDVVGDLEIKLTAGGRAAQQDLSVPAEPNGFYWVVSAGKFPGGQVQNAQSGGGSAVAFMHENREQWGAPGFRAWTKTTQLTSPIFRNSSGLAMTLRRAGAVVYDNNGIEDGTHGGYYNNAGGVEDAEKPGMWLWFSMAQNPPFNAIFATYFRLTQATTFDELIGYFDGNGQPELRFDAANRFNQFRMNIWSNGSGNMPAGTSFTGDVFSSARAAGTFAHSRTGVERVVRDGGRDPIHRLSYRLATPVTLQAGEYWFAHDTSVPTGGTAGPASFRPAAATERPAPESAVTLGR